MPAFTYHRQLGKPPPSTLGWFEGAAGNALLDSEVAAVGRALAMCPALPWLWIGPDAALAPDAARGVRLHRTPSGFAGDLQCDLPLPLASECFGAIFLQHALDDGHQVQDILEECARLLAPGGRLWLATLNPWSPYRLRWTGAGVRSKGTGAWQAAIRRAGFASAATRVQWLGPRWQPRVEDSGIGFADRFRSVLALSAGKQVQAMIPPTALRQLRWQVARWPLPPADRRVDPRVRTRPDARGRG
ncbi:methyltransferase domain-containing protein [Lysobacter ciconiae]|uniref:Methyltransferase domain-containing protein n=1 Tax=Novilysobacter ciconiae TaxID=2781022 RepID=A0A7S6UER0_9GAMM|nr:methyltransferase domain-containing protein [Lysobacter ciconiae]QOW18967.1 methyltransferase domain-containing protein [Lysobacter ciconiae]